MAAPTLRWSDKLVTASITSHVAPIPPGGTIQSGDTLVVMVSADGSAATATPPTGWIQVATVERSSTLCRAFVWKKENASGSETTADFTFTTSSGRPWAMVTAVLSTSTNETATTQGNTSGTSKTLPAYTTAGADRLTLAVAAYETSTSDPVIAAHPSGWTSFETDGQRTTAGLSTDTGQGAWYRVDASSGAKSSSAYTLSVASQSVSIVVPFYVTAANVPPTANAGSDQTVDADATVTLTGAASTDSDGSIIGYSWAHTSGPNSGLSSSTVVSPTYTASNPGTDVWTLTVTDDRGGTATDSVSITVNPRPPHAYIKRSGVLVLRRIWVKHGGVLT